ncbi:hypothetical protein FDP41_007564 [Naegleria fowleri]|uniref:Integrase zinc-binding domain-containing protein n=1 Tax=Naegleria fowleri TaxID=5763 RepID=A0A6A5CEB3_NAEFO|nr:uncharacterized protein FDP41_007564 [Naegleria fowleri]KAF0983649.1 hypothetical protein FDP41_007564 [Naegleria fowleri]
MAKLASLRKLSIRTTLESKSTNITSHVKKILPDFKLQDGTLYFNKYKSEEKKILKDNLTDEQLERIIDMTQQLPKDVYDVQIIKTDKWVQIPKEHEYEGIIMDIHVNQGHAGRDICESVASSTYYIPKFQEQFQKVKSSCKSCRTTEASKAIVLNNHLKTKCQ